MATGQGKPSRGENRPPGSAQSSCPSCRRVFVPTSREQQELESTGQIHRACKSCSKALVIVLRPDRDLDVTLDFARSPESSPSERVGTSDKASASPSERQPPDAASLREGISLPRSLAKLSQAVRTADERLGTALTAIQGMHECLEEIQAAQGKIIRAQLSEKSHKAMQETVAACNRLEQLSEKLEGAASRIFEQVQSKLVAPDGLRASLDVYHDWQLERCGDEERRLRVIERLPSLFDFVEMELRALRAAGDVSPQPPERQGIVAELEKLHERMKDWQASVGLVRFPDPGDAFDTTKHDIASMVETSDAAKVHSVKEVVRSGYRLGNDGPVLRRALVVRWVTPRGT